MFGLESGWLVPAAGMAVGTLMGHEARRHHFCTMSALERHWYAADSRGLRAWVLAALVALVATQVLAIAGFIDTGSSFYLSEPVPVAGTIIGGLMFGFGMALVGTCGFGAVVRLGGGNLRALVVLTGIGLAALSAQRGLVGQFREALIEPLSLDLTDNGFAHAGSLFAGHGALLAAALIAAAGLWWVLRDAAFRADRGKWSVGIVIGLCITAGWVITTLASQSLFSIVQVEAGSFVMPVGDAILQIITVTGVLPDYGIGLVGGVFLGAAIAAWRADDMRWEACDDARELSRHLLGAFLMGTGGVFALGCTIGQGVSAASVLALSVPLAMVSIAIGARIGLALLIEGEPFAFLRSRNRAEPAE